MRKTLALATVLFMALSANTAFAATEIQWWHAFTGRLGELLNVQVDKFGYSRPIKGAMGLAYNSVQGTFQSGGIRSYDLFGEALIQASKYEELRKQPLIWDMLTKKAQEMGLEDFHVLIVQEVVYNSLSPSYRELFIEVDVNAKYMVENKFQMMYDNDAKYFYFHVLE